ncbi:EcsC family protein [Rhodocaloribacter litoris]|uniref:EcsC family protein n=1 Tax=Rhodocaloribacter litoris TaxID=2558931 RepID=UPI00141D75E8|nr:EcsC family protein [Rhodocaloribacter litoris]QXD17012.1 EcsC family protein [Rhodocaloribacter litoris]GIV60023.1 MAG: ABC transporter substrate-binding protein [Rhodothermaceae bacterium]
MRLTPYERDVQREIEKWQHDDGSFVMQAVNWAMQPVDWVVRQFVSPELEDQVGAVVENLLSLLNDASEWTYDAGDLLAAARKQGLDVQRIEDLRNEPLEQLDPLARSLFTQHAILAAIEGGGTGLGGAVLIAADIPLLFTINLRLIQQIGAAYGFPMRGPDYRPLVLSIFNVAASGGREAKNAALREVSVAAAALANELTYKGRVSGIFREQSRQLPREIAKNLLGRKLAQTIPLAGAAVGAGINYWFTTETARAAYMLFRALYIERKERL